jgi:WD40 repeat protein
VAGKRPVQGVAVSPDNATLASADWNGVVSFWALDENMTQVKTFQARRFQLLKFTLCTAQCAALWHAACPCLWRHR